VLIDLPGAPKSTPLKNLANFSITVEIYELSVNLESFITLYTKFIKKMLLLVIAVETLSKIVSTIQDSANAVISANTF